MRLEARSCERPSKSSASVFLPSSVSNSYLFSTGTQGSSRRFLLISSFRSACSASSLARSSRAACHSQLVALLRLHTSNTSCASLPHGPLAAPRSTLGECRRGLMRRSHRILTQIRPVPLRRSRTYGKRLHRWRGGKGFGGSTPPQTLVRAPDGSK